MNAYREGLSGACPRCEGALTGTDRGGVGLDECGGCGGVFLGQTAVESVLSDDGVRANLAAELAPRPRYVEQGVRYLKCPRCARAMNRKVFARVSGVIVDVCKDDGVFFDGGELGAVLAFVDRGGLAKQAALEARERQERAKGGAEAERPADDLQSLRRLRFRARGELRPDRSPRRAVPLTCAR
ncbi:MAG: zf-TFIIB domain-containing protein [Myxococcales bacterium]|nr:zf-TFIIB domain-containing protein [Myxococcales bacterium]